MFWPVSVNVCLGLPEPVWIETVRSLAAVVASYVRPHC